jgi:predicted transcriptional regulator
VSQDGNQPGISGIMAAEHNGVTSIVCHMTILSTSIPKMSNIVTDTYQANREQVVLC